MFKTAAVRWSIHFEADGKEGNRLHVEASGNNVAGFRRTPAYFDEDALEIRLLEVQPRAGQARCVVLAYVETYHGHANSEVATLASASAARPSLRPWNGSRSGTPQTVQRKTSPATGTRQGMSCARRGSRRPDPRAAPDASRRLPMPVATLLVAWPW